MCVGWSCGLIGQKSCRRMESWSNWKRRLRKKWNNKWTLEKQEDSPGQILSSLGVRRPLTPSGFRGREETWKCESTHWSNSYNKTQLVALLSQICFWNKSLHVSDSSSVHHQEFFTVHTAIHTGLLCVQWNTADDGQKTCTKHVEFYSINKFEKLVHLVGFIIRIYHDARSPERQIGRQILSLISLRNTQNYECSKIWKDYFARK